MANEYDPYREALVVETNTLWPEAYDEWDDDLRYQVELKLHSEPKACKELRYDRMHTGFARVISVTPDDLARLGVA
jgi:hypothetical protein